MAEPVDVALDVGGACEVIAVGRFVEPALLAGGFTGLTALKVGTGTLTFDTAWVGDEDGLPVLHLRMRDGCAMDLDLLRSIMVRITRWREEDGEKKSHRSFLRGMGDQGALEQERGETFFRFRAFVVSRLSYNIMTNPLLVNAYIDKNGSLLYIPVMTTRWRTLWILAHGYGQRERDAA
jgi:hypothetical protein